MAYVSEMNNMKTLALSIRKPHMWQLHWARALRSDV